MIPGTSRKMPSVPMAYPGELDFCGSELGTHLIIAIRHLGRDRIVYQPVIFEGALPADERSAAALSALAVRDPEPIPVVAEMNVLRLPDQPVAVVE
jgi:hypothetical protein